MSSSSSSSKDSDYTYSMALVYSKNAQAGFNKPQSIGSVDFVNNLFPNRLANKHKYNYIKTDNNPHIIVTITDDKGEKVLLNQSFFSGFGSSMCSYVMNKNNNIKQYYLSAFYYGSDTRQGEYATVYSPSSGCKTKGISVYFVHHPTEETTKFLSSLCNNCDIKELPENTEVVFDKVINFNTDNLSDNIYYKFDNYMVSFTFRNLHKFNNEVEISSVKITRLDENISSLF
jgi:hypothetical protein